MSKFVCADCFDDDAIQAFVVDNVESDTCDFCGATGGEPIAAPIEGVVELIVRGIAKYYDDPNNAGMSYETAEGGWQGETLTTDEMLEGMGLYLHHDDGTLREAIIDEVEAQTQNDFWCEAELYRLSEHDRRRISWDEFCRLIKHERRYFFMQQRRSDDDDDEIYSPGGVLKLICSCAEHISAFRSLPNGTRFFRARYQPKGERFTSALQLGPPPEECAVQTNRMSPPGIVMTYVADSLNTALAETANRPGIYAIGEFKTLREILILDLTQLPDVPSPFAEVADSMEYDPRETISFLHNVSQAISQPIARDDRIHVEYVPTQVVTEYIRAETKVGGRVIDGIRYRSSRNKAGTAVVLFADTKNLVLPEADRDTYYRIYHDRWLELVRSKRRRVTNIDIAKWNRPRKPT